LKTIITSFLILFASSLSWAQFAPALGQPGAIAIHRDSSAIVAWANTVEIDRGLMQVNIDTIGDAWAGADEDALGRAGDNPTISLGDGGTATLGFEFPIKDGPGYDFAVYENSFDGLFLELAFVEVSSDGERFVRFPALSLTDTSTGTSAFGYTQTSKVHNLAGKYPMNFGTPFDLSELQDSVGLDIQSVRFVRIVDVIGTMLPEFASRDAEGRKVADPWPTPFPSSGFDLDAVAVMHNTDPASLENLASAFDIFPQPCSDQAFLRITEPSWKLPITAKLLDMSGRCIQQFGSFSPEGTIAIDLSAVNAGTYFIELETSERVYRKLCVKGF
jgi:hypothetical protein